VSDVFDAKAFLKTVTSQPGVYRMYDAGGTVIYVGKAKDLKKRLSSYFRSNLASRKTEALVALIAQIDVTVTHTETEALLLEHNYIKLYQPRYNVLLRDDKSYPLFSSAAIPIRVWRCIVAPNMRRASILSFSQRLCRARDPALLQKIFPIRQCENSVYRNRSRPCLQYQIGRCLGPCVAGLVSEEEYAQQVEYVRLFLAGKDDQVLTQLIARMEKASQNLEFEEAARIRDQIQAVRRVTEKQFVSNTGDDLDVIGVAFDAGMACVHVLFIRQGKVLGSRSYFPKVPGGPSWARSWRPLSASSICRAARCARCRGRFCSTLTLAIKRCWPIRCLNWRGVESMCRPNRAATGRVILSWRAPTPRRR
jgi:excinuclease ABC subunit C